MTQTAPLIAALRKEGLLRFAPEGLPGFTALTTARSDAVTMLASSPTPHRVLPPMRASTYAAARASAPSPSACSL